MTVCIAAYSRAANAIITVSDTLLSNDWESYDGAVKINPLHFKTSWFVLYAGQPEEYEAVRRHIKETIASLEAPQLDDVLAAATAAYAREICTIGDITHLAPLGLSRAEFLQNGLQHLGDAEFARILSLLSAVRLETSLLVIGFDSEGGHIARIDEIGRAFRRGGNPAFAAIGTGALAALGLLNTDPDFWTQQTQVESMVYKLCAAKFAAQAAVRSVGEKTMAMVFRPNAPKLVYLPDSELRRVRGIWLEHTIACPPDAIEHIKSTIQESVLQMQRFIAQHKSVSGD